MPKGWKKTPRRKYVLHETKLYAADWDWAVQQLRDAWMAILDFLEQVESPRPYGYFLYEIQQNSLRFRTADAEPERRSYSDRKLSKYAFRMEMNLLKQEFQRVPDEKQSEHNFWVGTKRIAKRLEWALRSASAEEPLKSRLKQHKKAASFQPFFAAESLKGESTYIMTPDKLSLTKPRTPPNMIGSE